jgi:hypothetical protein
MEDHYAHLNDEDEAINAVPVPVSIKNADRDVVYGGIKAVNERKNAVTEGLHAENNDEVRPMEQEHGPDVANLSSA